MNARTGRELWSFRPGAIESSPLVVDGVIYFGSWDRYVYALDAGRRRCCWRFVTDDRIVAAPAYPNGTIYIPSNGGRLYALDARPASERWRASRSRASGGASTSTPRRRSRTVGSTSGTPTGTSTPTGRRPAACSGLSAPGRTSTRPRRSGERPSTSGPGTATSSRSTRQRAGRAGATTSPAVDPGAPTVMEGLIYFATSAAFGPEGTRRVERGSPRRSRSTRAPGKRVWRFRDGAVLADRRRPRAGLPRRPDARLRLGEGRTPQDRKASSVARRSSVARAIGRPSSSSRCSQRPRSRS